MFENFRKSIARVIRPKVVRAPRKEKAAARHSPLVTHHSGMQTRMYQAARASRLTAGWATSTTSADSELISSLTQLRNRSRALVRDAAYAKRASVIVQNNVIGSGIGMQAQVMSSRDTLREDVNDAIEEAWRDWACAEYCHTGGTLHFCDFERAVMSQVFEAGEAFVRKHPRQFGGGEIPLALELIEAERIADEFMSPVPPGPAAAGAMVKMGIEVDRFGRPLAYWIRTRHPGELRAIQGETDKLERVPADQIVHLRLVDRWPQTRGVPWLHSVARKLNDMDGYSEAEIVAARGAANYLNTIETPEPDNPLAQPTDPANPAGEKEVVTEPGMTVKLNPGEKMAFNNPSRPNTALDPFMRYMLREVAAGVGTSYESLSRDYSQSNYSSSRLALLDDRDLWKMLQQWFLRNFRLPLHKEWLQIAVLSRAIPAIRIEEYATDPKKFEAVLFKPRGWSWIDPTKEVAAYKEAIKAGFTTVADVIAQTGGGQDIEDVLTQRERELKMMEEKDLVFDTSPEVYVAEEKPAPITTPPKKGDDPPDKDGDEDDSTEKPANQRVFPFRR
jgi:lambda family phage portal protein